MRVNNRLVLNGLLEELGLAGQAVPLLRALDKLPKIGRDKVVGGDGREAAGVSREQADRVLALAGMQGSNAEILARLEREFGGNARAAEGIARLRELLDSAGMAGIPRNASGSICPLPADWIITPAPSTRRS